jgi:hypothetical protein
VTPRRRLVLIEFLRTENAKGCGVDESLVRRWLRQACAEYGCSKFELLRYLDEPGPRKRRGGPVSVPLWDLG